MADKKISELTSASALSGTEQVAIVQSGATVKTTTQDIANLATPDVSGLVPYTGATSDVDLDTHILNAQSLNVKGTGGNGHLGLKHQSADAIASGSETVIFAGSDGEPRYKNASGTVAQFASRAWVTAQGYITNVITALGYTPVPNTRTINGYDLSANRTLTASDVSAVASNGAITGATKTKITYDSKGLVTSGADATTADIADSTNKRYVTDAQLTVIGNTSGTNTGDETTATIKTKLGTASISTDGYLTATDWSNFNNKPSGVKFISGASSILTGTTLETAMIVFTVTGNSFNALDCLAFDTLMIKTGVVSQLQFKLRINTSNSIAGSTVIATSSSTVLSNIFLGIRRTLFSIQGGSLFGFNFTTSTADDSLVSTVNISSTSYDVTQTYYWILTCQLTNAADSVKLQSAKLNNL